MLQSLTTNYKARHQVKLFHGREFLVAPCVMITAGVHAGSRGALYYPASELAASVNNWDWKPVVVNHPQNPKQAETQAVGFILNTRFVNGKLQADLWFDREKLARVDHRVSRAVTMNQVMEVSTGLLVDDEPKEGAYDGKFYAAIARNYQPHHLAILPDQVGACSVADSCGLLQNERPIMQDKHPKHLDLPVMNFARCCNETKRDKERTENESSEQHQMPRHLPLPKMTFSSKR